MKLLARVRSIGKSLLHRGRREEEISAEIAHHLAARAEDLERRGLSAAEARRRAKVEFGGIERTRASVHEAIGLRWFDELRGDLRYAWRMLWRSKGFTAVAVGSLALGIGANTTIFTLTKSVMLDRLVVPHPEQLKLIAMINNPKAPWHGSWNGQVSTKDGQRASISFSYPIYQQMREQNRADANSPVQDLFGFQNGGNLTITVDGHADVVNAVMVTGNFYQQMEVQPELGRGILPSDEMAGGNPVAVISDALWERMFARSPAVLGKTVSLNFLPHTIVGVNPAGFTGSATTQASPDVFVPITMQPLIFPMRVSGTNGGILDNATMWWVETEARLKPGASEAEAVAKLQTWLERDIRATMTVAKDAVMPRVALVDGSRGVTNKISIGGFSFYQSMYVLSALAGFVLLLACANLANLLLARSAARQREIGVRLALGASRGRVLRQVMTESLLLSSLGGVTGLALGYAARNVIPHLLSPAWGSPRFVTRFDSGILLFTVAVSLVTGLLFGVWPARRATRTDVNGSLKDASGSATKRRKGLAGRSIVAFQIALSMVLVVGAGLFARTLMNLNGTPLGFRPEHLLLFDLVAPEARYPSPKDIELHEKVEERLTRIPGVESVTPLWIALVSNGQVTQSFEPVDMPKGSGMDDGMSYNSVGQSFFDTYRIPILYGRGFDASDSATSVPVAVINDAAAKRIYHGANPVGRSFHEEDDKKDGKSHLIIGVAADVKYADVQSDAPPTVYTYYRQAWHQSGMTYTVKSTVPVSDLLPQIRAAVAEVDKDLPVRAVRTEEAQIAQTLSNERLFATLTAGFGVLALVLACIGIYGLMAYDVARRTSEIGIRMALGARAGQMLAMVLREAGWMALAGIGIGLGGALLLTKYVKSMLFGLQPNDPWVLGGAGLVLFVVAMLAGWGPARRASRVQPMVALRHE